MSDRNSRDPSSPFEPVLTAYKLNVLCGALVKVCLDKLLDGTCPNVYVGAQGVSRGK